jgi:hypothetical protein
VGATENDQDDNVQFSVHSFEVRFVLTQIPIVGVGLEQLFRSVQVETERQKDLHIGLLLQNTLINRFSILQLTDTNGIVTLHITPGVQWIHDLHNFSSRSAALENGWLFCVAQHGRSMNLKMVGCFCFCK